MPLLEDELDAPPVKDEPIDQVERSGIKRKRIEVSVKCGNCVHFKHHAAFEDVCINLGVLASYKPCPKFMIDHHSIRLDLAETKHDALALLVRHLHTNDLPLLAALLLQEQRTRRAGFSLGTTVFIRILGSEDYLSNYCRAYIIAVNNNLALLQGENGWHGSFKVSSILTPDDFQDKVVALKRNDKLIDPDLPRLMRPKLATLKDPAFEPPVAGEGIKRRKRKVHTTKSGIRFRSQAIDE